MKLNNKGFAITGILYGLLILFALLVGSYLTVLTARKNRLDGIVENIENEYNNKESTTSTYTLTLKKDEGVSTIYYKINGASSYSSTTSSSIDLAVQTGTTYYYYGAPISGYVMKKCTESNPCFETMKTSAVTESLNTVSSDTTYTVTLKKKESGTISTLTIENVNVGQSFSYLTTYSRINDNYQGISCTNGQSPTVSIVTTTEGKLKVQSRKILIESVTVDTTCTLTYGSSSGGLSEY